MLTQDDILKYITASYKLDAIFIGKYVEFYADEYCLDVSSTGLCSDHEEIYQFNSTEELKNYLLKKGLYPIGSDYEQLKIL